jgi:hypothetical protein
MNELIAFDEWPEGGDDLLEQRFRVCANKQPKVVTLDQNPQGIQELLVCELAPVCQFLNEVLDPHFRPRLYMRLMANAR